MRAYSWRVPSDHKGGIRIQTKLNLGPFEYKQSEELLDLTKISPKE